MQGGQQGILEYQGVSKEWPIDFQKYFMKIWLGPFFRGIVVKIIYYEPNRKISQSDIADAPCLNYAIITINTLFIHRWHNWNCMYIFQIVFHLALD